MFPSMCENVHRHKFRTHKCCSQASAARRGRAIHLLIWYLIGGIFCYMVILLAVEGRWMRQQVPEADGTIPVSIIRPVRGLDDDARLAHESLFTQDYGEYEIIFSLQDPDDPALPLIRETIEAHPDVPARIVVNPVKKGLSGKSSNLIHGLEAAKHQYVVFSDADIILDDPRALRKLVHPLKDARVGAVTFAPIGVRPASIWARIFHAYMLPFGAQTLSLIVTSKNSPVGLAGGTFASRKEAIEAVGGFAPYGDYAAEDMAIGLGLRDAGYLVKWIPSVPTTLGAMDFRTVHNVMKRWTLAGAKGFGSIWYVGYVMGYGYIWGILAGLTFGPSLLWPSLAYGGVRVLAGLFGAIYTFKEAGALSNVPLIPVADLLVALMLPMALVHPVIDWRGMRYRVARGGRLVPIAPR